MLYRWIFPLGVISGVVSLIIVLQIRAARFAERRAAGLAN